MLHTEVGEISREGGAPEEMECGWVRDEPEVSRRRKGVWGWGGGEEGRVWGQKEERQQTTV